MQVNAQEMIHRKLLVKTADYLLTDLYLPGIQAGKRDGMSDLPVVDIDTFEVFFHEENESRDPKDTRRKKTTLKVLVRDSSDKRLFDIVTYTQKFEYGAPASPLQITSRSESNTEAFVLQVELANNVLTEAVACILSERDEQCQTTH